MQRLFTVLPFLLLAYSCNSDADRVLSLKERVMEQHDVLMNREAELMHVKRELKASAVDSLKKRSLLSGLNRTSEFMMNWMAEFEPGKDTLNSTEAIEYFEGQITLLDSMAAMYTEHIDAANEALKPKQDD